MRISPQGLALIERYEGFSTHAYICPAGVLTIGYGHVLLPYESYPDGINAERARLLLIGDISKAESAIARFINVSLTQAQFDALTSFTYNVGAAALQRSTLRQVINRAEHAQAPRQFLRWVRSNGRILAGLVARRQAEAALYLS